MIGKLTGRLDEVGPSTLIVDVNGVGYEVTCAARTLAGLPAVGETVTLAIESHMREDAIRLYGFATEHERAWFRALQTVQGVGAKVALAVLGTLNAADLANAVALQDKNVVARAPGVGPKVASRIVAELKDKMPSLAPAIRPGARLAATAILPEGTSARDAVSALTNLGYGHAQAAAAVSLAVGKAGREARTEELIRLGLRELAQ
jgi:holliday junction DNA helicase RuvA